MTARHLIEDVFANTRAYPLWLRYVEARNAGCGSARSCWLAWRAAGGRP